MRLWLSLCLAMGVGCNGAETPPKAPVVDPLKMSHGASWELEPLTEADRDVSPVAAPGEVVAQLRWKSPKQTALSAVALAGLPESLVTKNLGMGLRLLVRSELEAKVNTDVFPDFVDAEAPVDVIVVADLDQGGLIPDPMFAYAIGLRAIEPALGASKGRPKRLAPGVWEIGTEDKWGAPCAIATAAGRAPARLVCGESRRHVAKLAPFIARNIATEADPPHDFRLELRLRKLLDAYGGQWASQVRGLPIILEDRKIGNALFDNALLEAAGLVADEAADLMEDLDGVVVDLGIDAQKGVSLEAEVRFANSQSWLVQSLLDGADKVAPAGDIVWRVPQSSHYVVWGSLGDPSRYDAMLRLGRELVDGFIEHEQLLPDADRLAVLRLLRHVQKGKHAPGVIAAGHVAPAAKPTTTLEILSDIVGWYVVGFDESPAELRKWLDEAVAVYNRPAVQKLLAEQLGDDAGHLPSVKKATAPAGVGKDALAIEVVIPGLEDPLQSGQTVDLKLQLLLVGDGNRTWIGMALDRAALGQVMAGLKQKGAPGSLAARTDLERMKSEAHAFGIVTSLRGITGVFEPLIGALATVPGVPMPGLASDALALLGQMPNQGATPLFLLSDVEAGPKPRVRITANLPRATVDDIAFVITQMLRFKP